MYDSATRFIRITALASGLLPVTAAAAQDRRPNIVVIVADDLLSSEISCYGGRNLETANIDRLAREGLRMTGAYASMAMSVPIRASLYTGLYPARHGSWLNHKDTFLGTKTVCEYMAEEGYRVARAGKNHPVNPDVYRFEELPGFPVNCVSREAPYDTSGIREFIARDDPRPFLLFVCSIHPHAPWTWGDPSEFDPDRLVMPENCIGDRRMREIFTHYLAEVWALDNEVGSVLKTLTECGELDNTLVLFLGEQGPQLPGGKWTCWYPGVHSALLARYPARIRPGRVSDAVVQYEDLLPTFIDLAGGRRRRELDGESFKKVLFGEREKARRYAYAMHNNCTAGNAYPVRSIRDERYALIWNLLPDSSFYKTFMGSRQARQPERLVARLDRRRAAGFRCPEAGRALCAPPGVRVLRPCGRSVGDEQPHRRSGVPGPDRPHETRTEGVDEAAGRYGRRDGCSVPQPAPQVTPPGDAKRPSDGFIPPKAVSFAARRAQS